MTWRTLLAVFGSALMFIPVSQAQTAASSAENRETNFRAYIELLRADIQAQRVGIITEIMQLSDDDATKFWPVYREYQSELAGLNDIKLAAIKQYAENYDNISEELATSLTDKILDFEAKRVALKKKYFDKMKAALSAKTAARFFQIENQILMLLDLQLSSMLPAIQ